MSRLQSLVKKEPNLSPIQAGERSGIAFWCTDPARWKPTTGSPVTAGGDLVIGSRIFLWENAIPIEALAADLFSLPAYDVQVDDSVTNRLTGYCLESVRLEFKHHFAASEWTRWIESLFDWIADSRLRSIERQRLISLLGKDLLLSFEFEDQNSPTVQIALKDPSAPGWGVSPEQQRRFADPFILSTNSFYEHSGKMADLGSDLSGLLHLPVSIEKMGAPANGPFRLFLAEQLLDPKWHSRSNVEPFVAAVSPILKQQLGLDCKLEYRKRRVLRVKRLT